MPSATVQRTFAGGELSPIHHARADTVKYLTGLRTCRNVFVRREGGLSNRSGWRYTSTLKTATAGTRLMPYVAAAGSDILIEMGAGYFRFFRDNAAITVSGVPAYNGATPYVPGDLVESGGVNYYCIANTTGNAPPDVAFWYPLTGSIYEIPTPYALDTLPDWDQSANVITLTEDSVGPRELIFESPTRWILRPVSTLSSATTPTGLAGVAGAPGGLNYAYLVTSAAPTTFQESGPSTPFTIAACAAPTTAAPNQLTWNLIAGAPEYYVYLDAFGNGVFGYIGTSTTNAFNDVGFVPDTNVTPPIPRVLFATTNNFPAKSARFQQRRWFANTITEPDALFGSRIGFPSDFSISSPLQDDDAVTFRIAASGNHGTIRHMRSLKVGLVLMTDGGAWPLTGGGGPKTPITPSSVDAEQETWSGVSNVRPVVVGNTILYIQRRASIVRELRFDQQVEGLAGRDLCIWAAHLFERKTIVAMGFQENPHSITWAVLSDGTLAGLTYIPEQEVWGWHRHDTLNGTFEDLCVVGEGDEDALYAIVARVISGSTVRYLERLARRDIRTAFFNLDTFFVDSGLTYNGAPATVFSGLGHLEGQRVAVLADGAVLSDGSDAVTFTVTAGAVTIPAAASRVHIGLPIQYQDIETLDLDVAGSDIRDKKKRILGVAVLVDRSSSDFEAGPDEDNLRSQPRQDWETTDDEQTGRIEISLPADWNHQGRVLIRMKDPLPLTILGIMPLTELGG